VRANGQDEIDLVLLDLKMPKVDGHEFLEIMAKEFNVDALNVTVVTSSVSTEDQERAHALGAGAYVIKDPDIHSFKEAIQSVIDEVAES
ncbi:MAG: response regulator, partial [Acidimicrobiia bacterium]|nr:response regulator [Acidimicrobiia bacterium]